jgi:YHS domain-containing protein
MRRTLLLGITLAAAPGFAFTRETQAEVSPVNVLDGERVAIHGYDPVAYFVEGGPRKGRADLTVEQGGAIWRFASEANRKRFVDDPRRYTPAYGGYCAYGVSSGYLVKIDPSAWTILNDRLYLNYDLPIRNTWLVDPKRYIAQADRQWPSLIRASGNGGK